MLLRYQKNLLLGAIESIFKKWKKWSILSKKSQPVPSPFNLVQKKRKRSSAIAVVPSEMEDEEA